MVDLNAANEMIGGNPPFAMVIIVGGSKASAVHTRLSRLGVFGASSDPVAFIFLD